MTSPKEIRLEPISNSNAKRLILANYRSGTFPAGVTWSLGAFVGGRCRGCVVFSIGARFSHTVIQDGRPGDVWELARLWLSDALPKNSESRVLSIATRLVAKHARQLKAIVTYTDAGVMLYKAAGWTEVPGRWGSLKTFVVDGVEHFSGRAVRDQYGSENEDYLRSLGHHVETRGLDRRKWVCFLRGEVALSAKPSETHPLEAAVTQLWRQAPKWLGWPGTQTIRGALFDESFVAIEDGDRILGCWLVTRLRTKPVFRGVGCCVDERARRRGVGRELVARMKALCDGERRMLTFDCKANNPALKFWDRQGFVRVGARRRGKGGELYYRYVYVPNAPEASR